MRSFLRPGLRAGLCLGVLTASLALSPPSQAQQPRPAVHRIEIHQGVNHFVDYVPSGPVTLGDRAAARDLQRAENELTYVDNLQRLKHQYVNSELEMEPRRLYAQEELYGLSINVSNFTTGWNYPNWGGGYGYPYAWNGNRYGGFGYGGFGYGGGLGGFAGGSGWSANRSLAHGMGDEGVMKNALVHVIAKEASPEYAGSVAKGYRDAFTAAAKSELLRNSLALGKDGVPPNPERTLGYPTGQTLFTLRGQPPISGVVAREDANWLIVRTAWGEVSVSRKDVLSYEPVPQPAQKKPMKPVSE
jgi:hypothetical protein